MSMGGGTKTVTQQSAPQLVPEGKAGFEQANQYFRDFLANPPIYSGPRAAPTDPLQTAGFQTAAQTLETQPASLGAANQEVLNTLGGNWMFGPGAQAAVSSLAAPIFQKFEQEVMPGIRDRAQFAGQGVTGTRRDVAEGTAIDELGRGIATGAIAPIFSGERDRMTTDVKQASDLQSADLQRALGLTTVGGIQRGLSQEQIDAVRQAFEEPIFRQSGAAESLAQMGGLAAGGTTTQSGSQSPGLLGTASSLGTLGLLTKLAMKP